MKNESSLTGLLRDEPARQLTEDELMFNKTLQSYLDKFGGSLPFGIGMPEITTELLLKAIAENKAIEESQIPNGAVS
jgi:hypothetical protein